jgi:hypothetical protein
MIYLGAEEIKITKRKPFKTAHLWLVLALVTLLVMMALPLINPVKAAG